MDDAEAFVRNVYKSKYKNEAVDKKRTNQYAKVLSEAVDKGWEKGGGIFAIDYDSPDTRMLNMLRDNVFHFSAAKNRAEIVELSALLRDEKGKVRSWNSFKTEALKVITDFQERYMKVEYDTAINSAYLAARWQEFDDDDVLVFRTAGDSRVRDSHRKLDGISLPKSHSFWKTFYPPLAWNCRCTVETTHSGRITPDADIPYGEIDNVPPIFRSNFAIEGMAFPKGHPYFEKTNFSKNGSITPMDNTELMSWTNANYKNYAEQRPNRKGKAYQTDLTYKGTKSAKEKVRKEKDWHNRLDAADAIAHHFDTDVFVPPTFRNNRDWRYSYFYNKVPIHGKMPDLKFNNEWWEMESYEGDFDTRKISKMLKHGKDQSPNIILKMQHHYDIDRVKNQIIGYQRKNKGVHKVIIIDADNKIHLP